MKTLVRIAGVVVYMLSVGLLSKGSAAEWPMRQRDAGNTGRASFSVPDAQLGTNFFDSLRWQKRTPAGGPLSSGTLVFYDGVGPNGADLVVGGYHWPKGVQGMDRHTGKFFWAGNPDGGESIGANSAAFSPDGRTVYVANDATPHPLMAFGAAVGPAVYWHNGADPDPNRFGAWSPKIATDGRIFTCGWNDRPCGAVDDGTKLALTWAASSSVCACYSGPVMIVETGRMSVVSGGRCGAVACWEGASGTELWRVETSIGTDADATVDPISGNVYLPAGWDSIYVIGLSKQGNPLWGAVAKQVFQWQDGQNNPQGARSAGCLSHDGSTYYFQTVSQQGDGRLYAVNTADGSLKWSFETGSKGAEGRYSSPVVTSNGVIIVGNNEGGVYYALRDMGSTAEVLDTLVVVAGASASASATVSPDGVLYLPARLNWVHSNGDYETPSQQPENLFNAFDLSGSPAITVPPRDQTVTMGSNALFSVQVSGLPPFSYQWLFNGSPIALTTEPELRILTVSSNNAGAYSVVVSNCVNTVTSSPAWLVVVPPPPPLDVVLDATNLSWTTGGDVAWFGQTNTTHDGVGAARSGIITNNQSSTLETTVTGPGTLSFWWRVSSEYGFDYLQFKVGDHLESRICGEVGWQQRIVYLGVGTQMLKWVYFKDDSVSAGQDVGWLDEVAFVPTAPQVPTVSKQPCSLAVAAGTTATLSVAISGTPPFNYQWLKGSMVLADQTNGVLTLDGVSTNDAGVYSVVVNSEWGSVVSSNAILAVLPPMARRGEWDGTARGSARGVFYTNGLAYLALSTGGLAIFSVTNPAVPQVLGGCNTSGSAYGVAVSGTYAYVADYNAGMQVIDISNPANPQRVGGYDTSGYAYGVAVSGNYAYVADGGAGLQVLDISNPANPQRVGGYDTSGSAYGVAVSGNYAYVADSAAGMQVIDIGNPSNPQRVGGYDTTGSAVGVAVSGNYAYVADSAAGLQVLDISNPSNPQRVGGYDTSGSAYGVAVSGNYAYVGDGSPGLLVVDISNPANPQRVGGYDTSGYAYGVAVSGNYAYVGDGSSGLQVVDISNPVSLQRVGGYDTGSYARDVVISGGRAFLADGSSGLHVVDVSNPSNPQSLGGYDTSRYAYGVAVAGIYAYVVDGDGGLQVIDISNPSNPQRLGGYDTIGYAYGVAVAGIYAYVADGDGGLQVIDISDPASPQRIGGWVGDTGDDWVSAVAVSGHFAYLADDYLGLQVIDISDPANPQRVGGCLTGSYVYGVAVSGNHAYLGADAGLQVVDISDRTNPQWVVDWNNDPGNKWGYVVAVAGHYAYLGYGDYPGLDVLDISNPADPQIVGSYELPSGANGLAVVDNLVYAAVGYNGLQIIETPFGTPPYPVLSQSTVIGDAGERCFVFTVQTVTGQQYRAESTADLSQPQWKAESDFIMALGSTLQFTNAVGVNSQRFYRVRQK